jgi:2-polyprenyl-3-methyl-5-hydroxy-6-metoxy-1,4-benzoquinol methylase
MSEDTDGKVGVRRQRTTRSERRRPSRQPDGESGSSWQTGNSEPPPPEESEPDAYDTVDEASLRREAWTEVSDTGPTDPPPRADGELPSAQADTEPPPAPPSSEPPAFNRRDEDEDSRRTAEIDIGPLQLPADDENAKTLPRLRLEGLAARIAAAEAAEAARSRSSVPPSDEGDGGEEAPAPSVIMPARIISVGPKPPEREAEDAGGAPPQAEPSESFEAFAEPDGAPVDRQSSPDGEPVAIDVEDEVSEIEPGLSSPPVEGEQPERARTPPPPPPKDRAKAAVPPPKRPPPPPGAQQPTTGQQAAAAPVQRGEDDRQKRRQVRQWWERFFSEDYLLTVLPPTQAQIAKQVDFMVASLGLERGSTILDVGCGLGLHSIELCRRGFLVVGLDLSLAMITRAAEAAQRQAMKINFVHADIREMEFEGAFDAVICMGTTFGFFEDDANRDVLARLHQALKPGGRILLDVVNRDYAVSLQPNLVWFEGDECVVMEESDFNYFNSRLSVKRTMMREDGRQSQADYAIRLYSLHELGQMMQQMGFRVIEVSGQEAIRGAFFGSQSPRIMLLAERRPQPRLSQVLTQEKTGADLPKPPTMTAERPSAELPKPPIKPTTQS